MEKSIISKINRNESMQTDSIFTKGVDTDELPNETDEAFDPTIAPIVNFGDLDLKILLKKMKIH